MNKTIQKHDEIRGENILILGYGREGKSVHRHIIKKYKNAIISIADNDHVTPLYPVARIYTSTNWPTSHSAFQTVVRSPGISLNSKELATYCMSGGFVTSATNIFFSCKNAAVVGVTGTKGKSTTTSLIAHLLSERFQDVRVVGNIGRPALDYVGKETKETLYVFELSSHQLSDVRYSPEIAVILPIVPEHLDYYTSFEAYVRAKSHITEFQKTGDFVVYNKECEIVKSIAQKSKGKKIPYLLNKKGHMLETQLLGNEENIAASIATVSIFGISKEQLRHGLTTFHPLPHRLQFVGEYKGIRFYNDSLATIPEATIHALISLGDKTETLIAGGFDRGVSVDLLGKFIKTSSLKTVILMGQTGKKIADAIKAHDGSKPNIIEVASMEEAVKAAHKHTSQGKICVLSPAATSFDQFKDYKDRGEQFINCVKKLAMT